MFSSMVLCFQVYWNTACVRWRVLSMLILNIWLSVFLHTDMHTHIYMCMNTHAHTQIYIHQISNHQIFHDIRMLIVSCLTCKDKRLDNIIPANRAWLLTGDTFWQALCRQFHSFKQFRMQTLNEAWNPPPGTWTPFTCVCEGKCTARQS